MNHKTIKKAGFTLIELLVVIAIIALLSSIVLASLSSARQSGLNANLQEEVHQVQLALELYYQSNNGYPSLASQPTTSTGLSGYYGICAYGGICNAGPIIGDIDINARIPTLFPTYFGSFSGLTGSNALFYYCGVSTNPCPYGSAWIVYPQTSGNTTTYYYIKAGATSASLGSAGSGS